MKKSLGIVILIIAVIIILSFGVYEIIKGKQQHIENMPVVNQEYNDLNEYKNIDENEKEEENEEFVKYTFYELRVKYNLTEQEINEVLRISRDYFQNKSYEIYVKGDKFEYQNSTIVVKDNELMIAIK